MKKKEERFVVLLAGGEGSRFWPQSRTLEPKQFRKNKSFSFKKARLWAQEIPDRRIRASVLGKIQKIHKSGTVS